MSSLERRVVLVTGANGFVGPHLARALAHRGAVVHGLGLGAAPASPRLAGWIVADLANRDALRSAVATVAPFAVVHLAGQSSAASSFEAPTETFEANVIGTWNLLEAVHDAAPRARVVVVSTSEVYGPAAPDSRVAEDAPFRPVSPYALSKAAAESLAAAHAHAHHLDVVRVRPFSHTGPGQTPRFVIPAWAQQIAEIEAGRAEPVLRVGNLEVTRDLGDVRDVAEGYCALLERAPRGGLYNLCRGVGMRLATIVEELAALARVKVRIEVDPARLRPADVPYLVGDPTAMSRDTGWTAEIPFEQTLHDVLAEWRARAASPA